MYMKGRDVMVTEKYIITGMTCAACSSAVERVTKKLEGVVENSVNLTTGILTITYDEKKISKEDVIAKVERAGFGAELYVEKSKEEKVEEEEKREKRASLAVVNQIRCFSAAGLGMDSTACPIETAPWPQRRKTESFTAIGLRLQV